MIQVVTDSGCDLPVDLLEQRGIVMVYGQVTFDGDTLRETQLPSPAEFYNRLEAAEYHAAWSEPKIDDLLPVYRSVADNLPGRPIISLHGSSHLFKTLDTAIHAAERLVHVPVHPTETGQISIGYGLIAQEVARLAADGADFTDVQHRIVEMRENMHIYFMLESVEYMSRARQSSWMLQRIGRALPFKPLLTIENGDFTGDTMHRNRAGQIKALERRGMQAVGQQNVRLAVTHARCEADARPLYERLVDAIQPELHFFSEMGPATGVNMGAGAIGLAWVSV